MIGFQPSADRALITKSLYLEARQCAKRAWLHAVGVPEPETEWPEVARLRAEEAAAVEALALQLFDDPVVLEASRGRDVRPTAEALQRGRTVAQATFAAGDLLVVADVAAPVEGGIELWEVKSSSHEAGDETAPLYDWDLAFQRHAAEAAGYTVVRTGLILLDAAFRLGERGVRASEALVRVDRTVEVAALLGEVNGDVVRLRETLARPEVPDEHPSARCKESRGCKGGNRPSDCGHLAENGVCGATLPGDWAGYLPKLQGQKAALVAARPGLRMSALDEDDQVHRWTPLQARAIRSAKSGAPEVDRAALRAELARVEWPVAYVDFEFDTAQAIPRHRGARPYESMPFQWSVRIEEAPGAGLGPRLEFLHGDATDPRRPFAESLLAALPRAGTLVAHHAPAETTVLRRLAEVLGGELADGLTALLPRFADTAAIARAGYYHPGQRGSYSLKVLAPRLLGRGYDDLAISNGMLAVVRWREWIAMDAPDGRRPEAREALLDYCAMDAELMHGILEELRWLAK